MKIISNSCPWDGVDLMNFVNTTRNRQLDAEASIDAGSSSDRDEACNRRSGLNRLRRRGLFEVCPAGGLTVCLR